MQPEYIVLKASKGHIVLSLNTVTDNVLNFVSTQYENNFKNELQSNGRNHKKKKKEINIRYS